MCDKLTVIIPFLNEGEEIANTLRNLRETANDHLPILLIDDSSTDHYDYEHVANLYSAQYIKHKKRKGVAASRDEGINMINTEYFVLLDGHMRFNQCGWDKTLLCHLLSDHKIVWCARTRAITKKIDGQVVWDDGAKAFGAYMKLWKGSWNLGWNYIDPNPESEVVDIPCILGACYASNKKYWQYLGGLNGLLEYGLDEQMISTKVWLNGGSCKLIKKLEVGHIYRTSFPYIVNSGICIFNRLLLTELLLPELYKSKFRNQIIAEFGTEFYLRAIRKINVFDQIIINQKNYFSNKFVVDFESLVEINKFYGMQTILKSKNI